MNSSNENFLLELIHVSDQEGKSTSVDDAPRFSAVYNFLLDQDDGEDGTLFLSSGDQWLPGLFYDASEDPSLYGLKGAADIEIQNELGVQISAFGNHEFDNGNDPIAKLLEGGDFGGALVHQGADFPYISGNIDFSSNTDIIEDGDVLRTVAIPDFGDNSLGQVEINTADVAYLDVNLFGSGAITEVSFNSLSEVESV